MKIIALANNKGGVCKTTSSLCLAAGIKERKKKAKVLLIDLDAQGNLAYTCGIDNADLKDSNLYDVFHHKADINNCVFQIFDDTEDFDIVAGGTFIRNIETESSIKEDCLYNALNNLKVNYDYIVIDTPPNLGKVTKAALNVADTIIIPAKLDAYSLQGIGALKGITDTKIEGILLNCVDERTNLTKELLTPFENTAKAYNTKLFKTVIHSGVAVTESQVNRTTIYKHAPKNRVTQDYLCFVDEFLKGVK